MRFYFQRFISLTTLGFALILMMTACGPKTEKPVDTPKPADTSKSADTSKPAEKPVPPPEPKAGETFAFFETSLGNFTVRLFTDKAPKTAQNFIDLATGKKRMGREWPNGEEASLRWPQDFPNL